MVALKVFVCTMVRALEIEYRIGPLDISDGFGKKLYLLHTDIKNGNEWSSDVNGMQINRRKRDTCLIWPEDQHTSIRQTMLRVTVRSKHIGLHR